MAIETVHGMSASKAGNARAVVTERALQMVSAWASVAAFQLSPQLAKIAAQPHAGTAEARGDTWRG
jgi:hypothetical protein